MKPNPLERLLPAGVVPPPPAPPPVARHDVRLAARLATQLATLLLALCWLATPALGQWQVDRIEIEGNASLEDREILSRITLQKGKPYAEWALEEDQAIILTLYQRLGFLEAQVEDFRKAIDLQRQVVEITIRVNEGPRTTLKSLTITGNTVFATDHLLDTERILLRPGEPLNGTALAALRRRILGMYNRSGYLYARVRDRHYFPNGDHAAEVYLDIEEGRQARVGRIEIKGNEHIQSYVIRRALELRSGEVYTDEKMRRSRSNLFRLGIIRNVNHELRGLEEQRDTIDVTIEIAENDFRSTGLGGGLGDVDGLRGYFEWGHYNLFERALNLTQLTQATLQPFEKNPAYEYSFSSSLTLRQHYFMDTRLEASTTALFGRISYAHHQEDKLGINVLVRNMITERRELSLLLELNTWNIFDVDTAEADQSVLDNTGRNLTNLVNPTIMIDRRDDRFNPEGGYLYLVRGSLAGGPLLGSINFYRFSVESSYLQPLWRRRDRQPLLLAGRVKLGVVREFGGTLSVPPAEAFNLGGARSLRGYSELSLGPINDRDMPGNVMVLGNLELRYPIWNSLGGVLFLDAGNLFEELHLDQRFRLLTTGGAGLRYRTPVGPIRFDVAFQLNELAPRLLEAGGDNLRAERNSWGGIHFGIGQVF